MPNSNTKTSRRRENLDIVIGKDATARAIYSDALLPLVKQGETVTVRASNVEPYKGGWGADMSPSGGGQLGPFTTRGEALLREVCWLKKHCDL